ncbi:MAG: helix-turn-helix transcriptional regulator, partial [bacterium]
MISEFIRKVRENRELTQEFVASELGLSRQTFGLVEKGERELSLSEAGKLAEIYGLSLEDLLNEEDTQITVGITGKTSLKGKKPEMRISIPQKNLEKFKEVLLYILTKIGGKPNIGETVI